VNFRLSEEEYEELKKACASEGARSVSDFARTAVWRMVAQGSDAQSLPAATHRIDRRLDSLEQQLQELAVLMRAHDPRAPRRDTMAAPGGGRSENSFD